MAPTSREDPNGFRAFMSHELVSAQLLSHSVVALVELGVPDILARAEGQLTAREIAAQLPSATASVEFLARLMSFSASYGVFEDLTPEAQDEETVVEDGDKRFGLTAVSSALVDKEAEDETKSMAPFVRFMFHKRTMVPFTKFSEAVLTGQMPFFLAAKASEGELGAAGQKPLFLAAGEVGAAGTEWRRLVNEGMAARSKNVMSELLKTYKFEGVHRLVDVGGGSGASLAAIIQTHWSIKGVNFDLPHVISQAPAIPRVEHVAGDMFQSVPEGDAIFMKWILHDWSDMKCVQLLQNCHKSLPENGKVIIAENVLPDPKLATHVNYRWDIAMLGHSNGRERTAPQWRRVLKAANFERVEIIPSSMPDLSVIEAYKSS